MNERNDEQTELLKEMTMWLRFMGLEKAKTVLSITLDTEKKILVYHLSDGKNTSTTISNRVGLSQPRISELWKGWLSLGLGESISASGGSRFKRSFDLKMFGISIPEIKQKSNESQESTASTTEETAHE